MASAAEQMAANLSWGTFGKAKDLQSRIFFAIGLLIGLVAGFFRWVDAVMMRVMDGLMAIPAILLAIAVVSLSGASIWTVMVAITIPEIPRVARLVRSVVLTARGSDTKSSESGSIPARRDASLSASSAESSQASGCVSTTFSGGISPCLRQAER